MPNNKKVVFRELDPDPGRRSFVMNFFSTYEMEDYIWVDIDSILSLVDADETLDVNLSDLDFGLDREILEAVSWARTAITDGATEAEVFASTWTMEVVPR